RQAPHYLPAELGQHRGQGPGDTREGRELLLLPALRSGEGDNQHHVQPRGSAEAHTGYRVAEDDGQDPSPHPPRERPRGRRIRARDRAPLGPSQGDARTSASVNRLLTRVPPPGAGGGTPSLKAPA